MTSLASQLSRLEATGLIGLAASQPEVEYLFRHALVQEAAYGSLVKTDRRGLHRAAGEALERLYPDRLDSLEMSTLLGRHFAEAGDDERALKYLRLAGDVASRVYAIPEAISHYTAALAAARRLGKQVTSEQWVSLYIGLGIAFELSARYSDALQQYGQLEALAQERNDRAMRLAAVMARAKIYSTLNPAYDPPQARTLLEQALALARAGAEAADRAAEARVLWNLMLMEIFGGGDTPKAIAYGEQSVALAREYSLREQLAYALNDIHYAYFATGQPARAEAALDESREIWRELGNLAMLADNLGNKSDRRLCAGSLSEAAAFAAEAYEISRSIGNAWGQVSTQFFLGHVHLEQGEPGAAIELMEDVIRRGEAISHPPALIATRADLAWAYGCLGAIDHGLELAKLAAARAESMFPLWKPWALAVEARLYILQGNLAEAEAALAEARQGLKPGTIQFMSPVLVALAETELELAGGRCAEALSGALRLREVLASFGISLLEPEARRLEGCALWELGQQTAALQAWRAARAQAEAMGSRRSLWPALAALSQAEAAQGHAAEAQALRRQAQAIVQYIAEHTGNAELRASFLQREPVRNLIVGEDS